MLHCCTKHVRCQKYEKYFLFTQRPAFQPKRIPEQDKVVSKRVEIIQINESNIILSVHIRRTGGFVYLESYNVILQCERRVPYAPSASRNM